MKIRPHTRGVALTAAALAGVVSLSGCVSASKGASSSGDSSSSTGGSVTIGVVMAKSGFMGPADQPEINDMMLELKKLNAAGGIGGKQVKLDVIDTETKLDAYAPDAAQVLAAGAKVLVVSCDYDVSAPAALAAQAKNVVTISPCADSPLFGPSGGLKLGFSLGNATPTEGSIMAEFAHSKGWKNVVMLTDTTLKYTNDLCRTFAQRFGELGGSVVSSYNYTQGSSIKETVSKITAGPAPDAVINCGYTPGGATAAKELRDGGVSAPILSGFGMDGDFWTGGVPGLKDYYVVTFSAINGDDPDQAINEESAAYQKAYGQRPSMGAFPTGTSTLQAIKAAYDKSHSWDGDKLAAAMESFHDENFLIGPTSFTKSLHITVDRPMRVMQVQNGKMVFVEKRTAQKVDFPS